MARIELAPEVFDDFERFFKHWVQFEAADAPRRIEDILYAIEILSRSPLLGRPLRGGKRELVIGQGSRGYVAHYRYFTDIESLFVLTIRSQRESGYRRKR